MEYTDIERKLIANQKELKVLMLQVLKGIGSLVGNNEDYVQRYKEDDLNRKIRDTEHMEGVYRDGFTEILSRYEGSEIQTKEDKIAKLQRVYQNGTHEIGSENKKVKYNLHDPDSIIDYVFDVVGMYQNIWLSMDKDGYHEDYNKFRGFNSKKPIYGYYKKLREFKYYDDNKQKGGCNYELMYIDFLGRYKELCRKQGVNELYPLTKGQIKYIQGISDEESEYLDRQLEEGGTEFIRVHDKGGDFIDFSE